MSIEGTPRNRESFQTTITEMRRELDRGADICELGPEYVVSRHGREPIRVVTYSFDDPQFPSTNLVALNTENQVIGRRHTYRRKEGMFGQPDIYWGEIYMGVAGKGQATQLETAFLAELQRKANQGRRAIKLEEHNQNAEDLKQLRNWDLTDRDMENLRKEQERWKALYGHKGKLGLKRNVLKPFYEEYTRVFKPEGNGYTELPGVWELQLECASKPGSNEIIPVVLGSAQLAAEKKLTRSTDLRSKLERILESVSQPIPKNATPLIQ